ncbi:MAG: hypothetical protein IPL65_18375 [Lewinellaceae bacterium]|nr:hypothetical protein [Lewinellaceae bacterium]
MVKICTGLLLLLALLSFSTIEKAPTGPLLRLSDYGFFQGKLADLTPAKGVVPYTVNMPLFSDYAEKQRFIYLPEGTKMQYDPKGAFDFPVGAVLIKNFFYYHDKRNPELGRKILETRLLMREKQGWKALEYLWDEEQAEAVMEIAGATLPVQWTDDRGKNIDLAYVAPNLNQCKGCHSYDGSFAPIGVSARQLNHEGQLEQWQQAGLLELPADFDAKNAPQLATMDDPNRDAAARAYLDANCAHCHNPNGPANTSGLFLNSPEVSPEHLGIFKPPVAAGRGAGKRKYGIYPGKPQESILLFRMESDDTGIRMPEIGRQLAHREGIALISAWIRDMGKK